MRTECMNCENKIEMEGDPFCKTCDPYYRIDDDGQVQSYYKIDIQQLDDRDQIYMTIRNTLTNRVVVGKVLHLDYFRQDDTIKVSLPDYAQTDLWVHCYDNGDDLVVALTPVGVERGERWVIDWAVMRDPEAETQIHWELGIDMGEEGTKTRESFSQLIDALQALKDCPDPGSFIDLWVNGEPEGQAIKKAELENFIEVNFREEQY